MRRGLRIGFTGAGGTGKTSTAQALHELPELNHLPLMKSASRAVYEAKEISEEIVASEYNAVQKWELQELIFGAKVRQDDLSMQFLADRTLLDHWAYCLMYCATDMPNERFIQYESLVRKHMLGAYSHIFYFPWGYFFAAPDGVRQDNKAWQYSIDSIIVARLHEWGIPVIEVPQTRGEDARADFIHGAIFNQSAQRSTEEA